MNEQQLNVLLGTITGLHAAVIHLCHVLDAKGIAGQEELARSFDETAAGIPAGTMNREHIQRSLSRIAAGLRQANIDPEIRDLLQRVQQKDPPAPD